MKEMVFILLLLFSRLAYAQDSIFDRAAQNYLAELKGVGSPVFYTACKTTNGTAMLILGPDTKSGVLFELLNGVVINMARLEYKNGALAFDFDQTQGGQYTYAVMANHARDMEKNPFQLSLPDKVEKALRMTAKERCRDKPPS